MKNSIWKQLLLSIILIAGMTQLASAQKYELIPQKNAKPIYGLQLKKGWSKEMSKLKAKEFFIKGNTLWVTEKYTISRTTEGGFVIHSKTVTPTYSAQDDNKEVSKGGGQIVYFVCGGCWAETECLVGSSGNEMVCTGCSDGNCNASFVIVTDTPARVISTPSGEY